MSEHAAAHGHHGHSGHGHFRVIDDPAAVARFAAKSGRSIRYRAFLATVRALGAGRRVLDVGAGPGVVAATVARDHPQAEVVALEPSRPMIEAGQAVLEAHGVAERVRFVEGNGEDRDLIASLGPFDLVYSTYALHHFVDPPRAIAAMMAGLAEGGVLVVHDLRPTWWLRWIPARRGTLRAAKAAFTPDEVRGFVAAAGARDFTVRTGFPFLLTAIVRG